MPNRLKQANSPYLLQHAENPVDWYPWSDEAFDEAARRDVPVFLSIGYATCHWCHVMEHESFEDPEVAELMNAAFVSVKVDREERPDLDHAYMRVCQAIGKSCGWPLTVLLTPDRQPFFVATYIPKTGRFGRTGMVDLIPRVTELWQNERENVERSAQQIAGMVQGEELAQFPESEPSPSYEDALHTGFRAFQKRFDATYGGFGSAPKFPSPHNLLFLLRYGHRYSSPEAISMAHHTLVQMASSGLMDQVGFGYHRYSTDSEWRLPHFEKMLYDQALLLKANVEAFQVTADDRLRTAAEQTVEYLLRDLQSEEGGFYCGEDADSDGEEGLFYLWTEAELNEALGADDAMIARKLFGTSKAGNYEDEATRQRTGRNVLHPDSESLENAGDVLGRIRAKLFSAREKRNRPARDEKVLTDWNGMIIASLAAAGRALGRADWVDEAVRSASWVLGVMTTPEGQLMHRYFDGRIGVPGMLKDYAQMIAACIELYQATGDAVWLSRAVNLMDQQLDRFVRSDGAFFLTGEEDEAPLGRQTSWFDGAIPTGNSVSLENLMRLGHLTGETRFLDAASRLVGASAVLWSTAPDAVAGLLNGLLWVAGPVQEVVLVGESTGDSYRDMSTLLASSYLPTAVVLRRDPASSAILDELVPWTIAMTMVDQMATAYVCEGQVCDQPITNEKSLRGRLATAKA